MITRGTSAFPASFPILGLVLVIVLAVAGCALSTVTTLDAQAVREGFAFLRDGETARQEVLDRLGAPAERYDGGLVLTYLLRKDVDGQLRVVASPAERSFREPAWRRGLYNLVLVFRPDGKLERHSIVLVLVE